MINIVFEKENNRVLALENDKKIGECDFTENKNIWNIVHTEVDKNYQGQGIARKLVEKVVEEADKNSKDISASCSYAKKIIEKK